MELDKDKWKLNGYNVWPTITTDSETPRNEILLSLNPARDDFVGQAGVTGNSSLVCLIVPLTVKVMKSYFLALMDGCM